jgi:transcriptional regulator with XRE-family HTH domain
MALVIERLRTTREHLNWSQRELARRCGLGEVQIYRYESGITDPSTDSLKKIAEVLNISTDFLLGLSDYPHGQVGDGVLDDDERVILNAYHREGWSGLARLSVERLSK